jgi:hypothetical protein
MSAKDRAAMARRRAKSGVSGGGPRERQLRFAKCIRNDSNPSSLKVGKVYQIVPDGKAAHNRMIRVVDELGEDYLYPEGYFVPAKNSG